MIDRVKKKIDWPGRTVQSDPERAETESGPEDESAGESALTLIDPDREEDLRRRAREAQQARQDLEQTASKKLDESMGFEPDDLPQTREAARMIGGTHPAFGKEYPEPPDERKLPDGKVTGEHFRRAYKTMENADRNAFGFSLKEAVTSPGGVHPYKTIDSPSKASGDVDPGQEDEDTSVAGAAEQNEKEQRLSMGKKAAKMVGGFLIKWQAQMIEKIGDVHKNALKIGIGPYSIGLGSLIAKPFYLLADWLNDIAEELMSDALGQDPGPDEKPDDEETGVGGDEDEEDDAVESDGDEEASLDGANPGGDANFDSQDVPEAIAGVSPSGGPEFLMAAHRVVRASVLEANREGGDMKEAIGLYDSARELKRDLDAQREMAEAWGVDDAAPESPVESPDRPPVTPSDEEDALDC